MVNEGSEDSLDDWLAKETVERYLAAFERTNNPVDALAVLHTSLNAGVALPESVQSWFLDNLYEYLTSRDPSKSLDKSLSLKGGRGRSVFRQHNRHHRERELYGLVYCLCTQFEFDQKEACKLVFYRESASGSGVRISLEKLEQGYPPWRDSFTESASNGWEFLIYWPPEDPRRGDYERARKFIYGFEGLPKTEVALAEKLKRKRLWFKRKVEAMPQLPTSS